MLQPLSKRLLQFWPDDAEPGAISPDHWRWGRELYTTSLIMWQKGKHKTVGGQLVWERSEGGHLCPSRTNNIEQRWGLCHDLSATYHSTLRCHPRKFNCSSQSEQFSFSGSWRSLQITHWLMVIYSGLQLTAPPPAVQRHSPRLPIRSEPKKPPGRKGKH